MQQFKSEGFKFSIVLLLRTFKCQSIHNILYVRLEYKQKICRIFEIVLTSSVLEKLMKNSKNDPSRVREYFQFLNIDFKTLIFSDRKKTRYTTRLFWKKKYVSNKNGPQPVSKKKMGLKGH